MKSTNKKLKEYLDIAITFTLMLPIVLILMFVADKHLRKYNGIIKTTHS